MVSIFASRPTCRGFNSQHSRRFSQEGTVNVAEVNQQHCLEKSGQWFENVNRTHLVLTSGKLVL